MSLTEIRLKNGGFVRKPANEPPPETPPDPLYSCLDFLGRFTDAEIAAIIAQSANTPGLAVWREKLALADSVRLSDQRVIDGVNYLVAEGVITEARAAEILSNAP